MKKGLYVTILGGIAAALLVFGCDFLLGPDEPVGAGNLVIGFGESGGAVLASVSRAAVPTAEEQAALRYKLVLTGPGGQIKTVSLSPGKTFNEQVALGKWRIEAEAYDPGNDTLIGKGSATLTVRAGKNEARVAMITATSGAQMTRPINNVSVPFRFVPAGSFQRDSTAANITTITNGYWMGETEVTQELFEAVMGVNPSSFSGSPDGGEVQNHRPVENVSWYAAIAFCNKLSILDGKDPVYSVSEISDWASFAYVAIPTSNTTAWNDADMDMDKNGYRLPTEMEWMWAAMGADTTSQPNTMGWEKGYAGSTEGSAQTNIGNYAWYVVNSNGKTHEVGKRAANELGLYDMSGNVLEWCWDWYGSYPGGTQQDPQGASSGANRVLCGGSWYNNAASVSVRSADRGNITPSSRNNYHGFRLVRPQF